ncbi:MAG TPA: hypothetical protein VFQ77_15415 [Pseudonocardiaceae bacterium]|jgi:hypothetical protein|nr:hypothetical protein [Pseudonocardiaceae bacterium]
MVRFDISYAKVLLPLFAVLGTGPRASGVELGPGAVRVRLGWAFTAEIPRRAIRSVAPDSGLVTGWGVHGLAGRWLVNGSSRGLVRVGIDPPCRARMLGIPVRLHTLRLSLDEPDAFIAALHGSPA